MEPDLRRECTRRDVVRAAEGGKKVVQGVLVCDVDGRELETHLVFVAAAVASISGHDNLAS